jgi:nitrite reductase/ring-hydroxylating ferredoxin subunit
VKQVICNSDDLPAGGMVGGKLGPMPIVVIRTEDGRLYGLLDKCLHMGGQLSKGKIYTAQGSDGCGRYVEETGRLVVKCPWHGYEYDLETGATLFDDGLKLRTFNVRDEGGEVVAET